MPLWLPWADLSFRLVAFGFQPSVTVPDYSVALAVQMADLILVVPRRVELLFRE